MSASTTSTGDDLVAFFRALSPEARREYEVLADLDRRFGEDVEAEQRANNASTASERPKR